MPRSTRSRARAGVAVGSTGSRVGDRQPALGDLATGDAEQPDGLPGPQLAVDLATGDAEQPDGLPGPQLAVALQPAVGQVHRLLVPFDQYLVRTPPWSALSQTA